MQHLVWYPNMTAVVSSAVNSGTPEPSKNLGSRGIRLQNPGTSIVFYMAIVT